MYINIIIIFFGTRAVSFWFSNGKEYTLESSHLKYYYIIKIVSMLKKKLYYFSYQEFVYFDIKYKGVLCYTSYIFNKLKKYNENEEGDIKCAVK